MKNTHQGAYSISTIRTQIKINEKEEEQNPEDETIDVTKEILSEVTVVRQGWQRKPFTCRY